MLRRSKLYRLPPTAACLCLLSPARSLASAAASCSADVSNFTLLERAPVSPDSALLRFALPPELPQLGWSGVKLVLADPHSPGSYLEKSYSPTSRPDDVGTFELLVKAYPPRPGGGCGAALCGLRAGEAAAFKVKPPRQFHGSAQLLGRWDALGFVAGGTGVAPFVQIIRTLLADPADRTTLRLLSVNRKEADILMKAELDALQRAHPDRLAITYALTQPPDSWAGVKGRGTVAEARAALPPPDAGGTRQVLVCGTDGLVETWAGPLLRLTAGEGQPKKKAQGALGGILKAAGFDETEVFKY
jgi:cytochrome-b5 reductase